MSKNFVYSDLIKRNIAASNLHNSAVDLFSDISIIVFVNATFVIEMFKSILFVGENSSCGSLCVNSLNNFGISGFKFTNITFCTFNIIIDFIKHKSNMFLFNEGIFFQKFRFDHFAGLNEDCGCLENVVNFIDGCSGEVSTKKG